MTGDYPNINGCKFCGAPKLNHCQQWHPEKGWHLWHTPTDAQRKARWKEHVNAREAKRRQQTITDTLFGLKQILTTNLIQELDPGQEKLLKDLVELAVHKLGVQL